MYHLQINHHEKELNYFDRAIYNSMINYCQFLRNLHIFTFWHFLMEKGVSYNYISPERKFYEEFKYAVELLIGSKGEWDMDLAKINFCAPQNPNIFSHNILVPDPIISYWMPYLNSSWNFLSENVYFWYGRAKIFQVKLSWSSRGAKFSESGDVTLRVASSKRMAISLLLEVCCSVIFGPPCIHVYWPCMPWQCICLLRFSLLCFKWQCTQDIPGMRFLRGFEI